MVPTVWCSIWTCSPTVERLIGLSKDKNNNSYRQACSIGLREPLFESGAEEVMFSIRFLISGLDTGLRNGF